MKILVVDNFDSFTYNLVHYLEPLVDEVCVFQNTEYAKICRHSFDKVILSPGPGLPHESGELLKIIEHFWGKVPILGVCLGMQALAYYSGENLYNLEEVKHGIQEKLEVTYHDELFGGLPEEFMVGLYHSWAVNLASEKWIPTSFSEKATLLSFRHRTERIFGVQFHPESVLTEHGKELLRNFLERA